MPFRVAIDARHYRDYGIGTHIRNLMRNLAEIDTRNHYRVLVRPSEYDEIAAFPKNFEPVTYDRKEPDPLEDVHFSMALRRLGVHVFHIPLNKVPLLMPRPYLVTVHDLSSLFYPQHEGWRRTWHTFRLRRGLLRASRVIAVSSTTKRDIEDVLGVPGSRIRVIHNAPEPFFLQSSVADDLKAREILIERYQIEYPYILYAGTIRPQKNIHRLVEAFAIVRQELEQHPVYRNLRLVIIGDEVSKYPRLRRAVIQTRVENSVRFLGFVPIETLRAFYKSASAFAFPSLYEGFGLPPIEAMACGTPVVSSDSSSLPEVVGDAAIIVNPENVFDIARGIREVLLDEKLRRRCVQLGLKRLNQFSWRFAAQKLLEIYTQVAAQR